MTRLSHSLASRLYLLGWAVVCRLPETWARRLFTAIADALWWRRGRGVRQLEANLARVLGPDAPPDRTRPGLDPQRLARTNADSSPEVAGSV